VSQSPNWRARTISKPILDWYRKVLPPISQTERDAIAAGTVWWDRDLFSGNPDWSKLQGFPKPELTAEEEAFLAGPVEQLCDMLDDWEIRRNGDLAEHVWSFIRDHRFMGMIIPKERGGLGFSALMHSQVVLKVASRSPAAAVTVMVPNSLGPAELLLRYGTEEQRDHYLPRLAAGQEIPCFALTAPEAGSDAASIPDRGVVCYGESNGQKVLGMRLTWEKRYITLAPVATLLGLAFRLYDPGHLIGDREDVGITLALIPANTPGVQIGRRHFPAGQSFQNGPTSGKDVFVPIDTIIGGPARAGLGWRMLMDCLAAGRAISLPALGTGAAMFCARYAGAYARIRRQFGLAIGRFEGIEEPLSRIAGHAYALDAARRMTASALDAGEQPSVLSAILKYNATERMRLVLNDAMDIHGGRGIMDGPRNYLFGTYMSVPVAITVEGANILTRSLMIFGQGSLRCHPWLLKEMEAASLPDPAESLIAFDRLLFSHLRSAASNTVRALFHNISGGWFARVPNAGAVTWMYRGMHATAVTFAAAADFIMGALGGSLKRREAISARLGDILGELYLMSCVLKRFQDEGQPAEDLPLVEWNYRNALYTIQMRLDEVLANLPVRPVAWLLRVIAFPLGRHRRPAPDRLTRRVASLILAPSSARERLTRGIYIGRRPSDATGRMEVAFAAAMQRDAVEEKIRGSGNSVKRAISEIPRLLRENVITQREAEALTEASAIVRDAIDVDDFAPSELTGQEKSPIRAAAE
jgi:acyl-CoA dehydrogenase